MKLKNLFRRRPRREIDTLYQLLYHVVHDPERSPDLTSWQTKNAFSFQWERLKEGGALLSDPWFKENVTRILSEEELQLSPEWFKGKKVLDGGCGNGRWSYALTRLGAEVTSVDVSEVALEETGKAVAELGVTPRLVQTSLESLSDALDGEKFDLVFSWGVAHHCQSYTKVMEQLSRCVKPDGLLYLYLYGRESMDMEDDLRLFKERIRFNALSTPEEKLKFLRKKAKGDESRVHIMHDIYAPLINRRLEYSDVKTFLTQEGFSDIERTLDHTELFIRAFRGKKGGYQQWILPKKKAPFWFERYN